MLLLTESPPLLQFNNLAQFASITHFISTRTGGISEAPYDSLNISFATGDRDDRVQLNRRKLCAAASIPVESLTASQLIHSDCISVVSKDFRGKGSLDSKSAIPNTDSLITNDRGICLFVAVADCVPILIYDPTHNAIGLIHAGRRGTLKQITATTIAALHTHFDSSPKDLVVGIGPSIGPCCYLVQQDTIKEARAAFSDFGSSFISRISTDGTGYLDLWNANEAQLIKAGVQKQNIERADICTLHNRDVFFSARSSTGPTGRFAAGLMLRH